MYVNYLFHRLHVQNKGKSVFVQEQVTFFFMRYHRKSSIFCTSRMHAHDFATPAICLSLLPRFKEAKIFEISVLLVGVVWNNLYLRAGGNQNTSSSKI